MRRRAFLGQLGIGVAAFFGTAAIPTLYGQPAREQAAGGSAPATPALDPSKPNILLIYADDLGYGDLGCYGATKLATPALDKLASEGIRFTDAHSPSTICTPSRYGLLTGRYPWRPETCWAWDHSALIFDPATPTLPAMLRQAGYTTACIGKWHLGVGTEDAGQDWNGVVAPGPNEIGFDESLIRIGPVFLHNGRVVGLAEGDRLRMEPVAGKANAYKFVGGKSAPRFDMRAANALVAEKALEYLDAQRGAGSGGKRPFFFYLPLLQVHQPIEPRPEFEGTSQCGPYGDFTQEMDAVIGRILGKLDELGLRESTLVIFASDNGSAQDREAFAAGHRSNAHLLGQKADVWEGGHRVPFIVRWPGRVPAGAVCTDMTCFTDVMATIAAITGQALAPDAAPDSINILPSLLGQSAGRPPRTDMIIKAVDPKTLCVREGDWALLTCRGSGGLTTQYREHGLMDFDELGLHSNAWTSDPDGQKKLPPEQLYNLAEDPGQTNNVYEQHPEIVARLRALLERQRAAGRSRPA